MGEVGLLTHSSVTSMLRDLKWESLADRRKAPKLVLFHKIHYKEVALDFQRDFNLNYATSSSISAEGTVTSHKLHRPKTNKRPFQQSTIISTVPAWNALTANQIEFPYSRFKKQFII